MVPSLAILAVNFTVPCTRAAFASGGYTGFGCFIRLACCTLPPTRIGAVGAFGFGGGGGGGGGGPILVPPRIPLSAPPATPPGIPPTTPAADGGSSDSTIILISFGTVLGAVSLPISNCFGATF